MNEGMASPLGPTDRYKKDVHSISISLSIGDALYIAGSSTYSSQYWPYLVGG
jgi:hypothetical protein